ncbi:ABC transporter permease subunit [Amycolatopsis rhizosphaerae]|uniref:ABC transporter permease subunit n=1 Tax=Amycolatopsis rhizosphaerae TaxID=2053003 RepID=A0A558C8P2_9PSEU|nr:ABC transporter permease subunit [Amycolatopsis rhizosphaerae]TVT45154.1 ABC transporter permease subunit [Amycolatopsis rhizosphaerae]
MLLWGRRSRLVLWAIFGVVFTVIVLAPLVMIVLASFAGSWTGTLPSRLTFEHYAATLSGDTLASLSVSVQTGVIASAASVLLGTWAALAVRAARPGLRRVVDAVFHLPIAVPSVVLGLALLVAFSRPPVLLNGTRWIVLAGHLMIVLPFTYSTVSAAERRADPLLAQVAGSLGASAARVLLRVRLPLLLPAMSASASLALAMSLGELGATIMLYPPDWRTLPVGIFALADRGQPSLASAGTVVLLVVTLAGVTAAGRARGRATER